MNEFELNDKQPPNKAAGNPQNHFQAALLIP